MSARSIRNYAETLVPMRTIQLRFRALRNRDNRAVEEVTNYVIT